MLRVEFGWFGRGGAQVGRLQVCVWRVEQAERKRWGMRRERKASPAVVCAWRRVLGGARRFKADRYGERKARMKRNEYDMVTHGASK